MRRILMVAEKIDPKTCEHVPMPLKRIYDGVETRCMKCHAKLRYSMPGEGKQHKSKKERRKEKALLKSKTEAANGKSVS